MVKHSKDWVLNFLPQGKLIEVKQEFHLVLNPVSLPCGKTWVFLVLLSWNCSRTHTACSL